MRTEDIIAIGRAAREAGARRAVAANPAVAEAVRGEAAAELAALRKEVAALREENAALKARLSHKAKGGAK